MLLKLSCKTVAGALETYLEIAASRVRITRVQLYEILDLNSQLEASSRPAANNSGVISPRSPKEKGVTSPRKEKKKDTKKGWSKSLEKRKANELVRKNSALLFVCHVAFQTKAKKHSLDPTTFDVEGMQKVLDESDSSERSGKQLLE